MKILITTHWYVPSVNGVVTSVLNLENELRKRGHEVRVLTLSPTNRSYEENGIYYLASASAEYIYHNVRFRTKPAPRIVDSILAWKPDIIHSQCELFTFHIGRRIAKKLNIPFVHTYHTVYEDYTHYFIPSRHLGRLICSRLSRYYLGFTDRVIVPSAKVKHLLEGYGITVPMDIIPTGIDVGRFASPRDEDDLRAKKEKYGIPSRRFVLLYLGRLAKEKNIGELLSFMPALKEDNITFLVVGGGPYSDQLQKEASALGLAGQIVFTGMVPPDEVEKYYPLGDVFVNASDSETQGLTYFEALAAGLPCVCRRDACLEGVIEEGINGWQYTNEEEFLAYIRQLRDNPALRERFSAAAKEKAISAFDTSVFAQRMEALYRQETEKKSAQI